MLKQTTGYEEKPSHSPLIQPAQQTGKELRRWSQHHLPWLAETLHAPPASPDTWQVVTTLGPAVPAPFPTTQ